MGKPGGAADRYRRIAILSSVLFAAIHMNLAGFPIYLLVGALFALVYVRTGSLLAPILAHVTYNGILLALIYLSPPA